MTHKKLIVKIAKVLRKYFNISFIDSLNISKAIVRDFCNHYTFLNKDEESIMIALHQLLTIEYDKQFIYAIDSAIDVAIIHSERSEETCGYLITYRLLNNKTNKTTDVTIEC